MTKLECCVGGEISVQESKRGEWLYWTWSPLGDGNFIIEYVAAPTQTGAIVGNRPNRNCPFYPVPICATRNGQGIGARGPGGSFRVTVKK